MLPLVIVGVAIARRSINRRPWKRIFRPGYTGFLLRIFPRLFVMLRESAE